MTAAKSAVVGCRTSQKFRTQKSAQKRGMLDTIGVINFVGWRDKKGDGTEYCRVFVRQQYAGPNFLHESLRFWSISTQLIYTTKYESNATTRARERAL